MALIRLNPLGHVISGDLGAVLHSDAGTTVLEGSHVRPFVDKILALLDGTRDRNGVVNAFSKEMGPSVSAFLRLLERLGLLEQPQQAIRDPLQQRWERQERFFSAWTDRPGDPAGRLRRAQVLIVGLEPWGVAAASQLAAAGVGALHLLDDREVTPDDLLSMPMWHAGILGQPRAQALADSLATAAPWCRVTTGSPALIKNYLPDAIENRRQLIIGAMASDDLSSCLEVARFAHEARLTSLFGSLQGNESLIGPVVVPGETACWNCCRLRLLANASHPWAAHALQEKLFAQRGRDSVKVGLAPMAALTGNLLALEGIKLLSGYAHSASIGRLLIQNMVSLRTTLHLVIPMPWCDVCGGAQAMPRHESKPDKLASADTPDEMQRALSGWLDSRTGVISYVVLTARYADEPSVPVCAKALLSAYTEGDYSAAEDESCGGKGLRPAEALVGAVGEAIERYSASRFRVADLCRAPLRSLTGDVLDPRRLCLYEDAQYDRPGFPFARFKSDRPCLWTRGRWLDNGQPVWVPALTAYYGFPASGEELFCQTTSNGLAAGSDLEDASLRAIFELVERDAFMLTWLCRLPGRRLTIDNALEPEIHDVVKQLEKCGAQIELYLLDVGLSIPTAVCLGLGDGRSWPGLTVSAAAHFSPRIAARKAILEQGYSGLSVRRQMKAGGRPIPQRPEQVRAGNFLDHALYYIPAARAAACDFLRSGAAGGCSLSSMAEPSHLSLDACAKVLGAAGIRVAIVDVTAPDVARSPFRVVRALGTDMQPIHCGFGLERLANPRLHARLSGKVNTEVHPFC